MPFGPARSTRSATRGRRHVSRASGAAGDTSAGKPISPSCKEVADGKASNSRTRLATERAHEPTRTSIPAFSEALAFACRDKAADEPRRTAPEDKRANGFVGSFEVRPELSNRRKRIDSRAGHRTWRRTDSAGFSVGCARRAARPSAFVLPASGLSLAFPIRRTCPRALYGHGRSIRTLILDQTWIEQRRRPSGCITMAPCGRRRGAQSAQLLDLRQYLFPESVMGSTCRLLSRRVGYSFPRRLRRRDRRRKACRGESMLRVWHC